MKKHEKMKNYETIALAGGGGDGNYSRIFAFLGDLGT
jgi:hypothetical protein